MTATQPTHNYFTRTFLCMCLTMCLILTGCRSGGSSVRTNHGHRAHVTHTHKRGSQLSHNHISTKGMTRVCREACEWIGTPYAYAGCEKGVGTDCSGMVMKIFEKVEGCKLPRNSAKQAEFCIPLKKKDVRPGDLVFFATGKDPDKISHVGIMIDDAQFVHASTSKGVVVSSVDTPYYIRTFMMYGRVPR